MIKGQLHESTSNNKDIQYAPIADMKKMKDLGYRFIRSYSRYEKNERFRL